MISKNDFKIFQVFAALQGYVGHSFPKLIYSIR